MKPYALHPPMTPPDDPPEPDLSLAHTCPVCGFMPDWEDRLGATEYRLLCTHHLASPWGDDIDKAVSNWNNEVESYGQRLKATGQKQVAKHNEEWSNHVLGLIRGFALTRTEFTIEHVRRAAHWEPNHANAWGAVFSVAAKQRLIVRVGYQKNALPSAHSRIVATWRGVTK